MGTYTQLLYQLVLGTKYRKPVLTKDRRDELYNYIVGILNEKNCHPYRINGVEDHIHILTHIHPTVAVSSLVKDIKMACSDYIRREGLFKDFDGWMNGFGAFTYSIKEKDRLIQYIINQEEHHRHKNSLSEFRKLLQEHKIPFDEKYLL